MSPFYSYCLIITSIISCFSFAILFVRRKEDKCILNDYKNNFYFSLRFIEEKNKYSIIINEMHYNYYYKLYGNRVFKLDLVLFKNQGDAIKYLMSFLPERELITTGESFELKNIKSREI